MTCGCNSGTLVSFYTLDSFVMPGCDLGVTVRIPGDAPVIVGGFFYNPTFGYLYISSFDPVTRQAYLVNQCTGGNADPGTVFPACNPLTFVPTITPTCEVLVGCIEANETNTLDLHFTSGELSGNVRVSSGPGNLIMANGDGLFAYVPPATCSDVRACLSVSDTSSIDMSYDSGTGVISAASKISAGAGNILLGNSDGLFVPPYGISDTNSVDMTLTGKVISSDVKISAGTGNILLGNSDGLFVPPYGISDTNTLDLTQTGKVISGDVKISAGAGNILLGNSDGLFVPPYGILDTSTIDLTLTGKVISGAVKISAGAGNIILGNSDGIFAYLPTPTSWTSFASTVSAGISCSGAMTIGSVVVNVATYKKLGDICWIVVDVQGTLGGTAAAFIYVPLPFSALAQGQEVFSMRATNGDNTDIADETCIIYNTVNTLRLDATHGGSNWALGASFRANVTGFYRTT